MSEPVVVFITWQMIKAGADVLSASDANDTETVFNVFKAMVEASAQLVNVPE